MKTRATSLISHQRGISMLGILVILAIGGFFLTIAFKVGPLYIDNSFVREVIESIEHENYREMSDADIRRHVQRNFDVNGIRDLSTRDMEIDRSKGRLVVKLDYEKRVNLMGNVDVVVVFENHFDSSAQ